MSADLYREVFAGLARQGPGGDTSTLRALQAVGPLPDPSRVLDIGCGTGSQTLVLARNIPGLIVAVDLLPESLAELTRRASQAGLGDRVEARVGSMTQLEFPDESFDLLWSEGAIYNMGFEAGLGAWRPLLRPGGCVAVTELSWLTSEPPAVARDFWLAPYPAMATREQNLASLARAGYESVESFALPEEDWWSYYGPLEERIEKLREKYGAAKDGAATLQTLDEIQREIDVFRASEGSYSYVFYIARRPERQA